MTDETFERIRAYAETRAIFGLLPDVPNVRVPVIVDDEIPEGEPWLVEVPLGPEVRLCRADFADLRRRATAMAIARGML